MSAKLAKRHYCRPGTLTSYGSVHHTKGNGTPRSKRCTYCAGELVIVEGLHAVFVWAGANRYPLEDAVKVFTSPAAAQRFADANAAKNYVVRWVSA